jgi:hypothetical protein
MKRSFAGMVTLLLLCSLAFAPGLFSQIKQEPGSKLDSIEGNVQSIDKAKMTIVIREKGTANLDYTITYTDKTIYTYRNGPAKMEDFKTGSRIYVLGKAEGANKLAAARIDIREK